MILHVANLYLLKSNIVPMLVIKIALAMTRTVTSLSTLLNFSYDIVTFREQRLNVLFSLACSMLMCATSATIGLTYLDISVAGFQG